MAIIKRRRGKTDFDLDRLCDDVDAEWRAYPAAQLDKMWDVKSWCFKQTIANDGWNTYERHRDKETKEADAAKRQRRGL